MPIKKFENFLDEECYVEAFETSKHLLTLGGNIYCTNQWWDYGIRKDSFPVLVHNVNRESSLYKKLYESIETKTECQIVDDNIMLYCWTHFSYIPWHNDNRMYDGAITIYLNDVWEIDWGGYFLYQDNDEIRAVIPKKNLGVMQYGSVMHATTPVHYDGGMRFTVQAFLKNK